MNEHCSNIVKDALPSKEKDSGSFTLPCTINNICLDKALADLGASVNVMPYSTFTNLGLGKLAPMMRKKRDKLQLYIKKLKDVHAVSRDGV
ncbi:DNA/RNA polymerases superfamily protein [Tanacetum coccineum]